MKQLLFLLLSALSISANASIYLVQQGGGNPAWSGTTLTDKTVVDLSTAGAGGTTVSFPAWYNTKTFVTGDQVWVIYGTYVFNAAMTSHSNGSVYGGFVGTEAALTERPKPTNPKYWEFTNETIFDGNNSINIFSHSSTTPGVTFDGFTITKTSVASKLRGSEIMQNCIFKNNTNGALLLYTGVSTVKNCYFYNNSITGSGGAVSTGGTSIGSKIDGCVFENNSATVNGAAINNVTVLTVQNCLITGSTGKSFIYTTASSNFYNNTFVNNNGAAGLYVNGTSIAVKIYNCVFWVSGGGTGQKLGGSAAANTANVELKNCAITEAATGSSSWTVGNNITLETTNTGSGSGLYYPGFADPAGNYKIATGSSLINAGMNITGMTTDFYGTTRPDGAYDIGYYELGGTTGVSMPETSNLNAYVQNGVITLRGAKAGQMIEIYNGIGQKTNSIIASESDNLISAPTRGIQIVKVGNWVRKVVLK